MHALKVIPVALAVALLAGGCENAPTRVPEPSWQEAQQDPLREANYRAAEALMRQAGLPASTSNRSAKGSSDAPLIVATLANVNALDQSSTLGRLISEQVSSWLTQSRQQVVELKVRNGIYMKRNEGEFLLTREIREVAAEHKARGVIVGVYAEGSRLLHVTLKLIDPETSLVLSAYDYTLPLNQQVKSLLRSK